MSPPERYCIEWVSHVEHPLASCSSRLAALLRHGVCSAGRQRRHYVSDSSSLFITVTTLLYCLLMNVTYFLARFVIGRCFCI